MTACRCAHRAGRGQSPGRGPSSRARCWPLSRGSAAAPHHARPPCGHTPLPGPTPAAARCLQASAHGRRRALSAASCIAWPAGAGGGGAAWRRGTAARRHVPCSWRSHMALLTASQGGSPTCRTATYRPDRLVAIASAWRACSPAAAVCRWRCGLAWAAAVRPQARACMPRATLAARRRGQRPLHAASPAPSSLPTPWLLPARRGYRPRRPGPARAQRCRSR